MIESIGSESITDTVERVARQLTDARVADARVIAEWLVSHVAGVPRFAWLSGRNDALNAEQRDQLEAGMRRLLAHEPLQYVIGETPFMNLNIRTDRRALIPRPETEVLVERVLALNELWSRPCPALADIGTGSGCIVIALAVARPNAVYMGVDRSAPALELARANAQQHGVEDKITWREGDLLNPLGSCALDAVVANLPYIASGDLKHLPAHIRDHEPMMALDGGVDGLDVMVRLVDDAFERLRSGGWIILEIGATQGGRVRARLNQRGYTDVRILPDHAGLDRIAMARKP